MRDKVLVSLRNLIKTYPISGQHTPILNGISLDILRGELLALVGASGSGKSTLLNILGLLDKPDSGTYVLDGQNVFSLQDKALAALRNLCLGFVFQQFHLLPRLTVHQNVALPLQYRQLTPTNQEKCIHEALLRVGMQRFKEYKPGQLSGGQQQRVAIARALVTEPLLILADEPTGSLDSRTGQEVLELFLSLHREGRTLVIVTHDELVAQSCAKRISMVDGCIKQGALA